MTASPDAADGCDWRPSASLLTLRQRAEVRTFVRSFFEDRGVLEVETPALGLCGGTDPDIEPLCTAFRGPGYDPAEELFLQTSPEFAHKRLLAAGSGPVYELARVFRNGERGARHSPEFTLLEWYRPGYSPSDLMREVEELVAGVLALESSRFDLAGPSVTLTWAEIFGECVGLDPHRATTAELVRAAEETASTTLDEKTAGRRTALHLLLTHVVEPSFPRQRMVFLTDYPESEKALARLRLEPDGIAVAERFELYLGGLELANGFNELTDSSEQRARFEEDTATRQAAGLATPPIDERLLAALDAGMPATSGVALGFDRLVMLATGRSRIEEVLAFTTP